MAGSSAGAAPWPLIEVAIAPRSAADERRLSEGLEALLREDPGFSAIADRVTGQIVLGGLDERHLDSKVDILRRTYKVEADIGAPQVAYRETLTRRVERDFTHRKQTSGVWQFARVKIVFEPNEPGAGNVFESRTSGEAVPDEFVPGVEKGIDGVMAAGILGGFPVVDVKATLIDGAFHDVDSSVLAFEIASRAAFREALRKDGSVLLEPIMTVAVVTPTDFTGSVIGDLKSRRGQIQSQAMRGDAKVITALVPLTNLFGYVNQLRAFTRGGATFTMQFDGYRPVVPNPDGRPPPASAAALRA